MLTIPHSKTAPHQRRFSCFITTCGYYFNLAGVERSTPLFLLTSVLFCELRSGRLNNLRLLVQFTFTLEQPVIATNFSTRYLHCQSLSILLPCFAESVDDFAAYKAGSLDVDLDEGCGLIKRVFTDDADVLVDDNPLELCATVKRQCGDLYTLPYP